MGKRRRDIAECALDPLCALTAPDSVDAPSVARARVAYRALVSRCKDSTDLPDVMRAPGLPVQVARQEPRQALWVIPLRRPMSAAPVSPGARGEREVGNCTAHKECVRWE